MKKFFSRVSELINKGIDSKSIVTRMITYFIILNIITLPFTVVLTCLQAYLGLIICAVYLVYLSYIFAKDDDEKPEEKPETKSEEKIEDEKSNG